MAAYGSPSQQRNLTGRRRRSPVKLIHTVESILLPVADYMNLLSGRRRGGPAAGHPGGDPPGAGVPGQLRQPPRGRPDPACCSRGPSTPTGAATCCPTPTGAKTVASYDVPCRPTRRAARPARDRHAPARRQLGRPDGRRRPPAARPPAGRRPTQRLPAAVRLLRQERPHLPDGQREAGQLLRNRGAAASPTPTPGPPTCPRPRSPAPCSASPGSRPTTPTSRTPTACCNPWSATTRSPSRPTRRPTGSAGSRAPTPSPTSVGDVDRRRRPEPAGQRHHRRRPVRLRRAPHRPGHRQDGRRRHVPARAQGAEGDLHRDGEVLRHDGRPPHGVAGRLVHSTALAQSGQRHRRRSAQD